MHSVSDTPFDSGYFSRFGRHAVKLDTACCSRPTMSRDQVEGGHTPFDTQGPQDGKPCVCQAGPIPYLAGGDSGQPTHARITR